MTPTSYGVLAVLGAYGLLVVVLVVDILVGIVWLVRSGASSSLTEGEESKWPTR